MTFFLLLYIFILGTVIGSFLNVCIYRLPFGKSIISPPSACGNCKNRLKAKDLIPIFSWIILKGKCGYCSHKISARYPLIEGLTGILFVITTWTIGLNMTMVFGWIFVSYAIVVAFIDFDHHKIHNKSVLVGLILVAVYQMVKAFYFNEMFGIISGLKGMLFGFLIMFSLSMLSRVFTGTNGIGYGDVKIYLPLGLLIGSQYILFSIWVMFIFSGVVAIIYKVFKGKYSKNDPLPLGPMIMLSAYVFFLNVN